MKQVTIDRKTYRVMQSEFNQLQSEYTTLKIIENVGHYDLISSLISNISNKMQCRSAIFGSVTHGGYVPINCSVKTSFLFDCSPQHQDNISTNIENNKQYVFLSDLSIVNEAFVRKSILYADTYHPKYDEFVLTYTPIIVSNNPFIEGYVSYVLSSASKPTFVLVPIHLNDNFTSLFSLYIDKNILNYDNLINLCVMVKNGGDAFVSMLESAIPFIDKWTILDTGSTDNTVENVKRIMSCKDGALYQEPFINFGASRNRCLELAGTQCTYNIMLDDTYHLKGDIRTFLQGVRGDQTADSFSLYITQPDIQYASNRIFKSKRNLKYKYAIHEVIDETDNMNVIIPNESAYIFDLQNDSLNARTFSRKQNDLVMLQEEINTNPADPRPYYYMAQTYSGMGQYENAYEWFLKRINHENPGFEQEKHESCLEAGRLSQFVLNRDPSEYLKHYELAHTVDPERPESLYFLGNYYLPIDNRRAFEYLLKGFNVGFPAHRQYCLKPSITYTHIPKLLIDCCYNLGEYHAGLVASSFFLQHDKTGDKGIIEVVIAWNKIFELLVHSYKIREIVGNVAYPVVDKPICCFIAPCGLYDWTGSDILKKGVGGSETFIIEIATHLQARGAFTVLVFCNCEKEEVYKGVRYIPLPQLFYILHSCFIHTCIISRYSEYLPVAINSDVENIFLLAHDTAFSGNVITINNKLKGVICLTNWHAECILNQFPALKPLVKIIGHGVDSSIYDTSKSVKIPYKFIYSSLANRGLYELLVFWPKIVEWQSSATLHIYSDIDSPYMLASFKELMNQIRPLLSTRGVVYNGFVSKSTLYDAWKTADIWLYPTAFKETYCVTALEAAASKTFAIACNVAGLNETVSNRGILIDRLDECIFAAIENAELKHSLVEENYKWSLDNSWDKQTMKLEELLVANRFEYRNQPNWASDLDTRTKFIDTFNQHLKPKARILEIGVTTGISILSILTLIPESTGVAIPDNDPDCEKKFACSLYSNIKNSGLMNRVNVLKNNSVVESLMALSSDPFDMIYVNNKSDLLDCYTELQISFALVKVGGIFIVGNLLDKRIIAFQQLMDSHKNVRLLFKHNEIAFALKE